MKHESAPAESRAQPSRTPKTLNEKETAPCKPSNALPATRAVSKHNSALTYFLRSSVTGESMGSLWVKFVTRRPGRTARSAPKAAGVLPGQRQISSGRAVAMTPLPRLTKTGAMRCRAGSVRPQVDYVENSGNLRSLPTRPPGARQGAQMLLTENECIDFQSVAFSQRLPSIRGGAHPIAPETLWKF
jgi:hypothetical protein